MQNFSAKYCFMVWHGCCFFHIVGCYDVYGSRKLCVSIHYLSSSAKPFWKFYKHLDFRQNNRSVHHPETSILLHSSWVPTNLHSFVLLSIISHQTRRTWLGKALIYMNKLTAWRFTQLQEWAAWTESPGLLPCEDISNRKDHLYFRQGDGMWSGINKPTLRNGTASDFTTKKVKDRFT